MPKKYQNWMFVALVALILVAVLFYVSKKDRPVEGFLSTMDWVGISIGVVVAIGMILYIVLTPQYN
jgi:membrane protein YdbS with pleckstrin-like domain